MSSQGGGQARLSKAAGGAFIEGAGRLASPARGRASAGCPGINAGLAAPAGCTQTGQGAGKCLSPLKFFMGCCQLDILTAGFYPEIMHLILGHRNGNKHRRRTFSIHFHKSVPTFFMNPYLHRQRRLPPVKMPTGMILERLMTLILTASNFKSF